MGWTRNLREADDGGATRRGLCSGIKGGEVSGRGQQGPVGDANGRQATMMLGRANGCDDGEC